MRRLPHSSILAGLVFGLLLLSTAHGQQSVEFDDFEVHYSATMTNIIPPEVARGYNIKRSGSSALLNISVIRPADTGPGESVKATVTASAQNLTGQRRDITLREIVEPGGPDGDAAVYYIGEFRVRNEETFDFSISVTPENTEDALELNFRQQFYTD